MGFLSPISPADAVDADRPWSSKSARPWSLSGVLSGIIYLLSAVIGIVAFTYPFFLPAVPQLAGSAVDRPEAPFLTVILLVLCLGVMLVEVQGRTVSAKVVAALGVLVAVTSVLRFLEVAIPGPGGFSPIFVPIILAGYVFGARFGFLMGSLTLLTSALLTGTVGPWLPYQMFAAGWVGLTAGWLPHWSRPGWAVAQLAVFGFVWGLLYGAIMNLYFWPFALGGDPATSWQAGVGVMEGVRRYAAFYAVTSLVWDVMRGCGNVAMLLVLGWPTVQALMRFRRRFEFVRG